MTDDELIEIVDSFKRQRLKRSEAQTSEDMNHRCDKTSSLQFCISLAGWLDRKVEPLLNGAWFICIYCGYCRVLWWMLVHVASAFKISTHTHTLSGQPSWSTPVSETTRYPSS